MPLLTSVLDSKKKEVIPVFRQPLL